MEPPILTLRYTGIAFNDTVLKHKPKNLSG